LRDVTPVRGNVSASTFQLGCTPVINLFSDLSEPIRLNGRQHEYHVIPDIRRHTAMEVYSIDSVVSDDPQLGKSTEYQPFYSFHHFNDPGEDPTFWYSSRRPSQRPEDLGSEVYLTLVDLGFNPHVPATNILTVHTTCTNRKPREPRRSLTSAV
jgi:type VI secretion system protein ImpG